MALGANAVLGYPSYLVVGREKAFKTYDTCTVALNFTKAKFEMKKDSKTLQEISTKRTYANRIGLGRNLSGEVDFYMASDNDACQYMLQNAFGGGATGANIASATTTGDTVGAGVFDHVYSVGNFDATYSSLCMNHRKGDATNGKVYEYSGFRVDSLALKGKVDDALMATVKMVGIDASVTGNDLSSTVVLNTDVQTALDFVGMRFSVEGTFNSLTTSTFWHVQDFELTLTNKMKADATTRRIGTDLAEVLPTGVLDVGLKCNMRFDDLTAYNAMMAQTQLSAQLEFLGATIAGSKFPQMIRFNLPKVFIKNAGDPDVGGPDQVLKSAVEFEVLRDTTTTTGYAIQAVVRNKTATY